MATAKKVKVELVVYDVQKCGLYETRESDGHIKGNLPPKHLDLSALTKELKKWAYDDQPPLFESATYADAPDLLECYCYAFKEHNGAYLLALWNKVPNGESGIATLNLKQPATKSIVNTTPTLPGEVPGFMTYFWFIPSTGGDRIVSVRIQLQDAQRPAAGTLQLKAYLNGFIQNRCSYLISKTENGEVNCNYCDEPKPSQGPDNRIPNLHLKPSILITPYRTKGDLEHIKKKASSVYKLVKKVKLNEVSEEISTGMIKSLYNMFNRSSQSSLDKITPLESRTVQIQMPVSSVTEKEVDNLLDLYEEQNKSSNYDVGFKISGESVTYWLGGTHKKLETEITLPFGDDDQPDVDRLLSLLMKENKAFAIGK